MRRKVEKLLRKNENKKVKRCRMRGLPERGGSLKKGDVLILCTGRRQKKESEIVSKREEFYVV